MKTPSGSILLFFILIGSSLAAPPPAQGRKLGDINVIPTRVLERSISPWFYKSLLVSPIEGWIMVRAQVSGSKLFAERVIHSDLDGAFDPLALKLAKELKFQGNFRADSQIPISSVVLHLLIYKIADGTMALSFAQLEGAGGDQMDYFGSAKLAVLKADGEWSEIKGPASLEGVGLAVRSSGLKNNFELQMKLERIGR